MCFCVMKDLKAKIFLDGGQNLIKKVVSDLIGVN